MDRQLPKEIQDRLCDIIMSHKEVMGVHDLRTRKSGQINIIQFHIDLDDDLSLSSAHMIAKQVEGKILRVYPNSDIIIHQDPFGVPRKISPEYVCTNPKIVKIESTSDPLP
jgi:ferrous-iron efflux pump FieF